MSEGSLKKKLLPAWAPLILVPPPTGTQKTYPPLSFALHVDHSRTEWPHLSSSLFVLLPLLSPLSHLKNLFLYTYFNSVIEDIKHTPLVWLLSSRRRNTIASFQNISFPDLISFLSRFFQVLIKLVVLSNSRITWR